MRPRTYRQIPHIAVQSGAPEAKRSQRRKNKPMTTEEIKGNLCYYDAENPNNNLDCYDDEEERPKPRENCHCDNCFYGRDKLARYILSNDTAQTRTPNT
jgi:hypothetical protein